MAELLMIADDMTGTLDSGVMLSARNIDTLVQIDCFADMDAVLTGCDAAVINTETRHLPQEEAFERIRRIVERAEALGVPYIYSRPACRSRRGRRCRPPLPPAGVRSPPYRSTPPVGPEGGPPGSQSSGCRRNGPKGGLHTTHQKGLSKTACSPLG